MYWISENDPIFDDQKGGREVNLYITADQIGLPSGGGLVTHHESEALKTLGPCEVWGREQLSKHPPKVEEPWRWDSSAFYKNNLFIDSKYKLAHFYAGTFSTTVAVLKKNGCKVAYTAAAHDIQKSKQAYEELGVPFNYPHLTDPELWNRYVGGYRAADLVICPSIHSATCMYSYGCNNIEIIPHGVDLPEKVLPLPPQFRVGYLGSYGPDKGVVDLLLAWKKLNYSDAMLVLGGRDSNSEWMNVLLQHIGVHNVALTGWVADISNFYNQISLYVQPSRTEGFGIEVLEAMAHGRAVVCSDGAGAADLLPGAYRYFAGNVDQLAALIDSAKKGWLLDLVGKQNRDTAEYFTWDRIRAKYVSLWSRLLKEGR